MARKKTTTTVEETEVTPEEQTTQVELGGGQLSIAEKLAQIIDPENDELFCRIYKQSGNRNAPTREFIERVDGVLVDEEYIAENYGGGCYFVRYVFKENGVTRNTSGVFTISETYRAKRGAPAQEQQTQKNPLAGLLENLTAEKVGGIVAAVEAVRKIFAPPVDLTKLMEAALTNRQQSVSDAVLLEAMKGIKQPQQPRNLLEEVRQLQEVKALIKDEPGTVENDDEEDDDKGGPMNVVKMALELLPTFLQQNNNNYEATGAQFRNSPVVNNLLAKDPTLREKFIEAARHEYGDKKTQELARGFGLDVQFIEPVEAAGQPEALETVKG